MPRSRAGGGARPWLAAWSRWRHAPRAERHAFCAALVLIPAVGISLRTLGVRRTLVWTTWEGGAATGAPDDTGRLSIAVDAVRRAERYGLYGGTCLSRSLALRYLLGRAGIATDLRFGGHRRDGRFEGHAWLERDGVPLNDTADVGRRMSPFRATTTNPSGLVENRPPGGHAS